ncbi:hypothetical protein, partial [Endozoicomonas sp. SESOKO4]|uniref:hypothetical protein n=1 Tax=Endozoicomonas sp. SESOKO4 TaxID=2828745 RepID=UPI002147C30C
MTAMLRLWKKTLLYISLLGEEILNPVNFTDGSNLSRRFSNQTRLTKSLKPKSQPIPLHERGRIISDSKDYRITYYEQKNSDILVIGFGGLPSKLDSPGFGRNLFLKKGYNYISVAQRELTQYQGLSWENFKEAVDPYIDNKRVFTYGSSLGAYCSLYYGGCINAQIISSAPKNSAHPEMLQKKFSHLKWQHSELTDIPISNKKPIILHDPFQVEEREYIERFVKPAYPDARHVVLPFWGHTILNTMKQSGVVSRFITNIIEN